MHMSTEWKGLEGYGAYEIIMMLHELHKRGYQLLRILPRMSPNGCCWRWMIYPKVLMKGESRLEKHNISAVRSSHKVITQGVPLTWVAWCNLLEIVYMIILLSRGMPYT